MAIRPLAALMAFAAVTLSSFPSLAFQVTSSFPAGSPLPTRYTCAGVNPALRIKDVPKGTRSLAILAWDEAPGGLAAQWIVYDLPASTTVVPEHLTPASPVRFGRNTAGKVAYTAPCTHAGAAQHLYFDVYALDVTTLGLPAGAPLPAVHAAIRRHRLREAKLAAMLEPAR